MRRALVATAVCLSLPVGWGFSLSGGSAAEPAHRAPKEWVVVAAGDIACQDSNPTESECHQQATSDLVLSLQADWVLDLGDNQYEDGSLDEFETYYDPTWGRFLAKTRPAPGNHEYLTQDAQGYFDYFLAPGPYYSFNIGHWHLVSLNSEIEHGESSQQYAWLRSDLDAHRGGCTLAYWHRPRWSSGTTHRSDASMEAIWDLLTSRHADLVLAAHEHNYERFARLDEDGHVDRTNGVTEFVAGTGGRSLFGFGDPIEGSQRRIEAFGVLTLVLKPRSFEWSFVGEDGSVLDGPGTRQCR